MNSSVAKLGFKLFLILFLSVSSGRALANNFSFEFYSGTFNFELDPGSEIDFSDPLTANAVQNFYHKFFNHHLFSLILHATKLYLQRTKIFIHGGHFCLKAR